LATIAAALKRVAAKRLKVKLSELGITIYKPSCDSFPTNKVSSFPQAAGLAQMKRYCEIITAYLDSVPAAQSGGSTVLGTTDANSSLDSAYASEFEGQILACPLLFDAQYKEKPLITGFADALSGRAFTNPP
jgi:endo-1,4-beta-xylanase